MLNMNFCMLEAPILVSRDHPQVIRCLCYPFQNSLASCSAREEYLQPLTTETHPSA